MFCTSKGTLINPTNLRKRSFAPLLDKAGLPHITFHMTFHQLRHTAATILLLKNVNPKIVSEMLGHASDSGSTIEVSPENSTECDQQVNQAASAFGS